MEENIKKQHPQEDSSASSPDLQESAEKSSSDIQEQQPYLNETADSDNSVPQNSLPKENTPSTESEDEHIPLIMDKVSPPEALPDDTVNMPVAAASEIPTPGAAEHIFGALSFAGFPLLILLALAATFLEVWFVRDLWFSDEVRLADTLMNLKGGDWLVLTLNGMPYPDKPPLYFWFIEALTHIPGVTVPTALFMASSLSLAIFTASVWVLARGTGHDRRTAFAAGLVVLSALTVTGSACYLRMDLLFAAVIALAMTCLYRGWIKNCAPFWLISGFVLMGIATLVKGPLGIAFAIISSILFAFWRGTPGRLNSRDGLPGFALMLILIAGWMGVLYLEGNGDYLKNMLTVQLAGRVLEGGHHAESWWYYLIAIPVVWLPWTLLILFVNWLAALRNAGKAWKTRKSDGGSSWLWIWFISGTAILSAVQAKMAIYALPLLAPLAVLTARSLLRLNPARSRCFFGLTAAFLAVVGLGLVLLDVFPFMQAHLPSSWLPALPKPVQMGIQSLNGTMYIGGILILLAVVLLFFTRLALPGGSLLVMAFGMMLALQPYEYQVAPELSSLLSPRAQAAILAEKMQQGYDPAAFHVYPGAYAWHLNLLSPSSEKRLTVPDLNTEADRDAWLTLHPRTVLVMPTADWEQWSSKPEQAELVKTLWMVHQPYSIITITPSAAPTEQDSESSAEIPSAAEAPASDPIKSESSEDTAQSQL